MTLRGFLLIVLALGLLVYFFGRPREWWDAATRAARQVHAAPADTVP